MSFYFLESYIPITHHLDPKIQILDVSHTEVGVESINSAYGTLPNIGQKAKLTIVYSFVNMYREMYCPWENP